MNRFQHYWKELQRRHVVKAGIAYLVAAWLITQVVTLLLPLFKIPDSISQTIVIILAIGFPIWLIVAWVYDFSPKGIKKTEDVPYDPEISAKKNVGLNRFIIGGLSIAVILLVVNTFRLSEKVDSIEADYLSTNFKSSLAILPLDDLSPKKDQRYISDGLSRSIHTELSKIKELKLIPTSSSFQFRDSEIGIEVIAEKLGVRYLLEGSAQLIGDRFRADINLVDSKDNSTIWSKSFTENITDVYQVYDEVARNISEYLDVTLAISDVRSKKVHPEAYLLFLKAEDTLDYYNKISSFAADSLIRRSISIDPNYAESHASMSIIVIHSGLYYNLYSKEESIRTGLNAAREAIRLDSSSFLGYIGLSNWKWHDRDVEASMYNLNRAFDLSGPNVVVTNDYAGFQAMRMNELRKAHQLAKKILEMDPLNRDWYMYKLYLDMYFNNYDEALKSLKAFNELDKAEEIHYYEEANIYRMKGDLDKALEIIEKEESRYWYMYVKSPILYEMGKIEAANILLDEIREFPIDSIPLYGVPDFELAEIYAHRRDYEQAFYYLDKLFDYNCIYLEWFFFRADFKNLYDDSRWDAYIDRLSKEFNYDFPHRPE